MKEFNLTEYLKNPSKKVITRDGRYVRIICTNMKSKYPLIALVTDKEDNKESLLVYKENGKYYFQNSINDLFFASEKKDKFDPCTLKPFDRVLVRNFKAYKWKCEHFSYFNEGNDYPCICSSNSYAFCVPYNDETKYLVGISNEAPEYYRYWEE